MPCYLLIMTVDRFPVGHPNYSRSLKAGDAVTAIPAQGWDHGSNTLADDRRMWVFIPDLDPQEAKERYCQGDPRPSDGIIPPTHRIRLWRFDFNLMPSDFNTRRAANVRLETRSTTPKTTAEIAIEAEAMAVYWFDARRVRAPRKSSPEFRQRVEMMKARIAQDDPMRLRDYAEVRAEFDAAKGFTACTASQLEAAVVPHPVRQSALNRVEGDRP